MNLDLENKIVIVTGANGGIGSAICQEFLKEGSHVIAFYRGDEGKISHLVDWANSNKIEKNHLHPMKVDIGDISQLKSAIDEIITTHKKIDVLVNNAGWTLEKPYLTLKDEEWEKIISINLSTLSHLSKLASKHMFMQREGNIVNISSVVGTTGGRGVCAYSVAKAGVNRLTECMALELGRKGVRVNAVCPGVIDTGMSTQLQVMAGDRLKERTPLERSGTPDEVAKAVLFLASNKTASYITGAKLYVDGGVSL